MGDPNLQLFVQIIDNQLRAEYDGPYSPFEELDEAQIAECVPSENVPVISELPVIETRESYHERVLHVPVNVDANSWICEEFQDGVVDPDYCGPTEEWPNRVNAKGNSLSELGETVFPRLQGDPLFKIGLHFSEGAGALVRQSFIERNFNAAHVAGGANPFAIKWLENFPKHGNVWTTETGDDRTRQLPIVGKVQITWRMWVYTDEFDNKCSSSNEITFQTSA